MGATRLDDYPKSLVSLGGPLRSSAKSSYGPTRRLALGRLTVVSVIAHAGSRLAPQADQSEQSDIDHDASCTAVITSNSGQPGIDVPSPQVSMVVPAMNEARSPMYVFARIPRAAD
jgi:hypothetical protein